MAELCTGIEPETIRKWRKRVSVLSLNVFSVPLPHYTFSKVCIVVMPWIQCWAICLEEMFQGKSAVPRRLVHDAVLLVITALPSWLIQTWISITVFGKFSVRISTQTPAILKEVSRGFTQPLQTNSGLVSPLGHDRSVNIRSSHHIRRYTECPMKKGQYSGRS
jgi:hypothetical protein